MHTYICMYVYINCLSWQKRTSGRSTRWFVIKIFNVLRSTPNSYDRILVSSIHRIGIFSVLILYMMGVISPWSINIACIIGTISSKKLMQIICLGNVDIWRGRPNFLNHKNTKPSFVLLHSRYYTPI